MPTNKQRREAARRHLERQLQRRQEREAVRKRNTLIASIAGTLVIIGIIVTLVVVVGGSNHSNAGASGSATASASAQPTASPVTSVSNIDKTTGACGYTQNTAPASSGEKIYSTGYPPDPKVTPTTDRVVTFATNRGTITMKMNAALAPCNDQSIAYLIGRKYYNNTSCHRLVTTGIYVLQCGDPSGTGAGGPTYQTKDENLTKVDYKAGVVAMANAGANTNGSQFFIIYKDSSSGLGKDYTEIGTITAGMNIVNAVAAGGSDNSNGTGDGKPKLALTFKTVTVAPALVGSGTPVASTTTTVTTPSPSAS